MSQRVKLACRSALALAFLVLLSGADGCGYHVGGRAANVPSGWKTIAVPAFVNRTSRYRIEQRFTEAVIREFLTRTSYHVIQDESAADGVLHGEILAIETSPVLFDARSGQVTAMLVTVHTRVDLRDRVAQQKVYHADDWVFREQYQISTDVKTFFEEQDPALERMSRDFAAKLVSGVLENF